MKRAKEHYSEYKEVLLCGDLDKVKEACGKLLASFIYEVKELIKMRNAKLDSALDSIIREQNNKWNSLCDRALKDGINFLNKDSVDLYFKDLCSKEKR